MPKERSACRVVPRPVVRRRRMALVFAVVPVVLATLTGFTGDAAAGRASGATSAKEADPVRLALDYVRQNRAALGLQPSDLADVAVSDTYVTADTGTTHVYLVQRHRGIEVFNAMLNVAVARDGSVSASASRFFSNVDGRIGVTTPGRSAAQAVEHVARHLGLDARGLAVEELRGGPANEVVFNRAGISLEPIHAQLVYEPVGGALRLAWQVELYELDGDHWWNVRIDAVTGDVLAQDDYVDDAGTYTVFGIPNESPDDGPRSTIGNPDVAPGSPFGWHDTNGATGAEYTITRGNNAYAYTDVDANNSPDPNSAPNGGSVLTFDFALDLTRPPSSYRPASVTNLFYWSNVIHDVFYNHGFTEASGNFQSNNYGRGGRGADPVLAESQDGSGKNNANFATPRDGFAPRMQMFEWTYPFPNEVVVNSPAGLGPYLASSADFGPQLTTTGVTGDVTNAVDSGGTSTTDGCEPFVGFPAGAIALVDRGTCNFAVKAKNAQNAGAKAVIVVQNSDAPAGSMGGSDSTVTIPSVMVAKADGNALRSSSTRPNVTLRSRGMSEPNRDSSFDDGVVAHEYGHGISNRLTGGPTKTNCLNNNEQMGEGWSDFIALVLTADAGETGATARGMGTYLMWEPSTGFGIRPTPYSTDMNIDPVTYGNLPSLAIPHGVGYAWASMLWEVYWNLVGSKGFNPNIYAAWSTGGNNLALRLVVDGMKIQPCSPGFVDGRNAIVEADRLLTGGANKCAIWRGFARRGLGANASQGSSSSTTDGRQDFTVPAGC